MCGFPSCLFFMTCDLQSGCGDFDSDSEERRRRRPRVPLRPPVGPRKGAPAAQEAEPTTPRRLRIEQRRFTD